MAAAEQADHPQPARDAVRSEHSGAFIRLSRLWERRTHHSLVLAMVDSPRYRDALIARLNALRPGHRADLGHAQDPQEWEQMLVAARAAGADRLHLCLALTLARRGRREDHAEIERLLSQAQRSAEQLRLPEAAQIAGLREALRARTS